MRYSVEPRGRIYVKGCGFLSFAKNMGKNLSYKYGQKLLDNAKKSTMDAVKTASKRAIQKPVEATGDLIGNKIADKITRVSTDLHSKRSSAENSKKITFRWRNGSTKKKIHFSRTETTNYWWIKVSITI